MKSPQKPHIHHIIYICLLMVVGWGQDSYSDTLKVTIYPDYGSYLRVSDYQVSNYLNTMFYKGKIFNGIYGEYYPCTDVNGKLKRVGVFKDGKPEGIFKGYYESGQLLIEENYHNGVLKSTPRCMDVNSSEIDCNKQLFIKPLLEEPYWNQISSGYDGQIHISPYKNFGE